MISGFFFKIVIYSNKRFHTSILCFNVKQCVKFSLAICGIYCRFLQQKYLFQNTSLHVACDVGHVSCVALLLQRNADFSCRNSCGKTPLDLAMDAGNTAVVMEILDDKTRHVMIEIYTGHFWNNKELPIQIKNTSWYGFALFPNNLVCI